MPATTDQRTKAHQRAENIRLGLQQTALLYAQAVEERDWQTLGYHTISAWRTGEFGPDRFSAERRREIVALLTNHGWTQRDIATATGASTGTISNDQQHITPPDAPQSPNPLNNPRQRAARDRETNRRQPPAPAPQPQPRDGDDILARVNQLLNDTPPPAQPEAVTLRYYIAITIEPRDGHQIPPPGEITTDVRTILNTELRRRYNPDAYHLSVAVARQTPGAAAE